MSQSGEVMMLFYMLSKKIELNVVGVLDLIALDFTRLQSHLTDMLYLKSFSKLTLS